MQRKALLTAAAVFDLVAMLHLARLIFKVNVVLGTYSVPLWVSVLGFIIPQILAIWMFRAARNI